MIDRILFFLRRYLIFFIPLSDTEEIYERTYVIIEKLNLLTNRYERGKITNEEFLNQLRTYLEYCDDAINWGTHPEFKCSVGIEADIANQSIYTLGLAKAVINLFISSIEDAVSE
jgi:hypothetical protein